MRISIRGLPAGAWPLARLFAINGAMLSSWFVWIATIQADLALTNSQLGTALWGLPAALLVGTFLSEPLMRRIGVNHTLTLGVTFYCLAMVAPGLARNHWELALALALPGLGNGIMEPPAYLIADRLKEAWGGREIVGYMTAAFGAMQIVAPLCASGAILLGVAAWAFLGPIGVLGALVALQACRRLPVAGLVEEHGGWRRPPRWWRWVLAVALLGIAGFVVEGIWAEWHGVFLSEPGIGASLGSAALAYPLFQAAAMPSRLAFDPLVGRYGRVRLVVASAIVVLIGAGLIVTTGSLAQGLLGALVLGLGAGPIAPIAFSTAGRDPKAVVVVSMLCYFGLTASPPSIGPLADVVGLRLALLALAGTGLIMLVTAPVTRQRRTTE